MTRAPLSETTSQSPGDRSNGLPAGTILMLRPDLVLPFFLLVRSPETTICELKGGGVPRASTELGVMLYWCLDNTEAGSIDQAFRSVLRTSSGYGLFCGFHIVNYSDRHLHLGHRQVRFSSQSLIHRRHKANLNQSKRRLGSPCILYILPGDPQVIASRFNICCFYPSFNTTNEAFRDGSLRPNAPAQPILSFPLPVNLSHCPSLLGRLGGSSLLLQLGVVAVTAVGSGHVEAVPIHGLELAYRHQGVKWRDTPEEVGHGETRS